MVKFGHHSWQENFKPHGIDEGSYCECGHSAIYHNILDDHGDTFCDYNGCKCQSFSENSPA